MSTSISNKSYNLKPFPIPQRTLSDTFKTPDQPLNGDEKFSIPRTPSDTFENSHQDLNGDPNSNKDDEVNVTPLFFHPSFRPTPSNFLTNLPTIEQKQQPTFYPTFYSSSKSNKIWLIGFLSLLQLLHIICRYIIPRPRTISIDVITIDETTPLNKTNLITNNNNNGKIELN